MQQLSLHYGPSARVRVAHGPRQAEKALLDELMELVEPGGDIVAADDLAKPVLVVVPSTSLRRHLLARALARSRNGALLGVDCRTHLGLAASLVAAAGGDAAAPGAELTGFDFFALFARRLARREKALADSLDHLVDGYGAVLAAVRDLLDAGFEPALADALDEALRAEGSTVASRHEIERARALLRVAAGTRSELDSWALGRSSDLLARAALAARRRALPARRVLIHGFNDATGLTTDFLLALLAAYGGTLVLDHPPDPADRHRVDPGIAFSRNFRERVAAAVPAVERPAAIDPGPAPRLAVFRALGAEAETREVARRVRRLLEAGTRPEDIAVVVRRLEDYASALRAQFSRLAVPFSADQRRGAYDPRAARLHALLQLLRDGPAAPIERWLDGAALARGWTARADLQLALHTLGAGRLGDVAALDLRRIEERGGLQLPAGRGFEPRGDGAGALRPSRRWIGPEALERAVTAAAAVSSALAAWPVRASASDHARRLFELVDVALAWPAERGWREARAELRRVIASLPAELELDLAELQLVLGRELVDFGRSRLGGEGGGVRVLDVTSARSLTFEHLFVLGLNRGVFPRQVREDPILPDPLRQVLARSGFGVLPDLPVKRNGFHEERYLFAQLLAASPRVTLSWQEVDDQQKNLRAISPLLERLRLAAAANGAELEEATARPVFSPGAADDDARPAWEAAVLSGLAGDRDRFRDVLAVALGERDDGEDGAPDPGELAAARVAALAEIDPPRGRSAALDRLGPWLGAVGEIALDGDPRPRAELFVTALEKLARCPWKHFLEGVLRLQPLPDPLEAVPGVEPLLIGLLVHDVLEAIVEQTIGGGGPAWEEALAATGSHVPWPEREALDGILLARARALVAERDLGLPGLDRALALAAAPHLETARREDFPGGRSRWPVIASEIVGSLPVPAAAGGADGERLIRFRADRMDRTDEGYSFTDYKTGRWAPPGPAAATAGERLLAGVRSGEWLQAAAYAMAGAGRPSHGRYLYLSPLFDDDVGREFAVFSGQAVMVENFARALASLLALWDRGALFPRLVDLKDNEPRLCSICDVADACVRGDSGTRRRLTRRLDAWRENGADSPAAEAVLAVWDLARPPARRRRGG